jgi:hypothetical protein
MALDKTFSVGEVLNAGDVNGHLLGLWIPLDKRVVTSGSPVSSISFSSLDSNFRVFRLTISAVCTTGQILMLRFNNDSGSNYAYQLSFASGSSTGASRLTAQPEIRLYGSGSTEPVTGTYLISKIVTNIRAMVVGKTALFHTVAMEDIAANWNNTSTLINRIDIVPTASTFYGVFALEGMRGS